MGSIPLRLYLLWGPFFMAPLPHHCGLALVCSSGPFAGAGPQCGGMEAGEPWAGGPGGSDETMDLTLKNALVLCQTWSGLVGANRSPGDKALIRPSLTASWLHVSLLTCCPFCFWFLLWFFLTLGHGQGTLNLMSAPSCVELSATRTLSHMDLFVLQNTQPHAFYCTA